ncbi:MAG TPA: hypothetical protein VGM98_00715 [Schlesneria sp.]|jgi:hypothetical protein
MKPYFFVLPESFEPSEFLKTPELQCRFDDARYFVSLILTKLAQRVADDDGFVVLHAAFLKNIMRSTTYADVIEAVVDGGAVERSRYYVVGEKSYGFRLTERFIADKHVRLPVTDARLIRRLAVYHEQHEIERKARMKPVHLALDNLQHRLQIRGSEARQNLAKLPPDCNPFDVQGILIADIENHVFHSNVGSYGRMTNNISSLKRELRYFLCVNGQSLVCVDLSSAQPALLAKMIVDEMSRQRTRNRQERTKQSKYDSRFGEDVSSYQMLVQDGRFYDVMLGALPNAEITRNELKRRILQDVIAKKGRYPSDVEDTFRQKFPSVFEFIQSTNQYGREHGNLIRLLQRAESELVIETVADDLVTRFPGVFFLTLHDAVYTTATHVCKVEQAFRRAFKKTGFQMQFKVSC